MAFLRARPGHPWISLKLIRDGPPPHGPPTAVHEVLGVRWGLHVDQECTKAKHPLIGWAFPNRGWEEQPHSTAKSVKRASFQFSRFMVERASDTSFGSTVEVSLVSLAMH